MGLFSEIFGGGGAESNVNTNITSKNAVEVMAKNIMNCKSNTIVTQKFTLSGNYNVINGYKMIQNMKLSTSCSQDVKSLQDIKQSVTASLQAAATAQGEALAGAFGNATISQINSSIANEVSQKITAETVLDIINTTNAQQEAVISGDHNIITNFEMSQTLDLLQENCQKALSDLKSVQTIDSNAKGNSDAKQANPFAEIINGIFGGLSSLLSMWVIIFIVACIFGLGAMYYIGPSNIIAFFSPAD
jgi:hypothetical protein